MTFLNGLRERGGGREGEREREREREGEWVTDRQTDRDREGVLNARAYDYKWLSYNNTKANRLKLKDR